MKMIKYVLLIALLYSHLAAAQLYVNSISGYSIATAPLKIENRIVIDGVMNVFNASFDSGKGVNLGFGIGYNVNETVAVALDCNTQILTASTFENDWTKYYGYSSFYASGINGAMRMKNRSLHLAPLVVYSVPLKKLRPYIKAGLNVLFAQRFYDQQFTNITFTSFGWYKEEIETEVKDSGKVSVGFRGAFGVSFKAFKKLNAYGEFVMVNTNYKYRKSTLLSYKLNGQEELSTIEEKTTEYRDDEALIDYSHIGLNIGVTYTFGEQ